MLNCPPLHLNCLKLERKVWEVGVERVRLMTSGDGIKSSRWIECCLNWLAWESNDETVNLIQFPPEMVEN